jgi:hypothetical protein
LGSIDGLNARIGSGQQLVQIRDRGLEVDVAEVLDDIGRRGDELRDGRPRARDVEIVGFPGDRQKRVGLGIDIVDLEIAGAGDALGREAHAESFLDLRLGRIVRVRSPAPVRPPISAEESFLRP